MKKNTKQDTSTGGDAQYAVHAMKKLKEKNEVLGLSTFIYSPFFLVFT